MSTSKRRRRSSDGQTMQDIATTSFPWRDHPALLNVDRGFCRLPSELIPEILSYFLSVEVDTVIQGARSKRKGKRSSSGSGFPGFLSPGHAERSDILRCLAGTCRAWRILLLPFLWDRLDVCFSSRAWSSPGVDTLDPVYKFIATATIQKCNGLIQSSHLTPLIRTVNVTFTRYRMDETLSTFANCLGLLPNLRTIHILYANPQMPKAIKAAFEDVVLPSVRTVIIPGTCHEILKGCPAVERVWCIQGSGHKLVTVLHGSCKNVEEVRGFQFEKDPNAMKRLVKGLPTIQVLELNAPASESALEHLSDLPHLKRIDLRIPRQGSELEEEGIQRTVRKLRSVLRSSPGEVSLRLVPCAPQNLGQGMEPSDVSGRTDNS